VGIEIPQFLDEWFTLDSGLHRTVIAVQTGFVDFTLSII